LIENICRSTANSELVASIAGGGILVPIQDARRLSEDQLGTEMLIVPDGGLSNPDLSIVVTR
jgi:hypothetical protein